MKDKLEENWQAPDGSTVKEKSESPDRISLKGCLVGTPSRRSVVDQDTVPESLPRHAEGVWSDESHVTDNIHIPAVDQGVCHLNEKTILEKIKAFENISFEVIAKFFVSKTMFFQSAFWPFNVIKHFL